MSGTTPTTPTYSVCNGTEIRVVTSVGIAARLKVTAGALGIVDVYGPDGRWDFRTRWSPVAGLQVGATTWAAWPAISTALMAAWVDYVSRRLDKPRRRERPRRQVAA